MQYWIGLGIVGLCIWALPFKRTLGYGTLVLGWCFAAYLLYYRQLVGGFQRQLFQAAPGWLKAFAVAPVVLVACTIVVYYVVAAISSVQLLRKEGFTAQNSLLMLGVLGLGGAAVVAYWMPGWQDQPVRFWSAGLLLWMTGVVLVEFASYAVTTIVNSWHLRRHRHQVVLVLGAGLIGDQVPPLLAGRIQKGVRIWRKQKQALLVMSGGQGPDEWIPEAQAMKQYAVRLGVPAEAIVMESASTNTEENVRFSKLLLERRQLNSAQQPVALVTNYFHVLRALALAEQVGLPAIGYGARTKLYYLLNAFIRDFIGYLLLTKRAQALVVTGALLLYGALVIFQAYLWK